MYEESKDLTKKRLDFVAVDSEPLLAYEDSDAAI